MSKKAVPGSEGIYKKTREDGSFVCYVATWRDPVERDKNGEKKSRSKSGLQTLSAAKKYRLQQLSAIGSGKYINPDRSRTTWA